MTGLLQSCVECLCELRLPSEAPESTALVAHHPREALPSHRPSMLLNNVVPDTRPPAGPGGK